MFRCVLAEIFSLGGGHALSGGLTRAVAWTAAVVVSVVLCLWIPLAAWLCAAVRLASIVEAGRHGRRGPVGGRWHWKPMLVFVVLSYGFLGATRTMALEAFKIPSSAMSPTFVPGDLVMGDKISLRWREPSRGEVVVFRAGPVDFIGRIVAVGGDEVAVRGGVVHLNGTTTQLRLVGEGEYIVADDEVGKSVIRERTTAVIETIGGHEYRVLLTSGIADPSRDFPSEEHGCAVDARTRGEELTVPLEPGRDASSCRLPAGTLFILGDNRGNSYDSRARGAVPVSAVRARVVGIVFSRRG